MQDAWTGILVNSFREVAYRLAGIGPRLLAALTLLLAGWALAAVVHRLTVRLLQALDLDGRSARLGVASTLSRAGLRRPPSELIGRLVFWIIFAIGLLMAIEALEVPAAVGLAPIVIKFLPNLLIAVLVMVIGWLVANFLAEALLIFIVNSRLSGGRVMAGALRWLVLLFAASVALTQIGIAREMVLLVFGILFGGTVLGLALAFGLGGRRLAEQALERWLGRRDQRPSETSGLPHV
jgi:small-conductance mechanosensitive channel